MRASAPTGFRHPRKGRHTGRPLRADGQRVAAAQPLAARPLTDAAYPLRVKRNARKEKQTKCVLAPRPKSHPRRGNQLPSLYRTPPRPSESPRKHAGTISRRPPYSNFARTCKVATKAAFSFGPCTARFLFRKTEKKMGVHLPSHQHGCFPASNGTHSLISSGRNTARTLPHGSGRMSR